MRLFIALPLPETVRARLKSLQERVRGLHLPVRLARTEGLHLTLAFLGETAEERVPALEETMAAACAEAGPLSLRLASAGVFPNTRRPRVLWVGLGGELAQLGRLHDRLREALRHASFPVEERAFRPHITLGRAQERWEAAELRALEGLLAEPPEEEAWRAEDAHLVLSELHREGARYTTLYTCALGRQDG